MNTTDNSNSSVITRITRNEKAKETAIVGTVYQMLLLMINDGRKFRPRKENVTFEEWAAGQSHLEPRLEPLHGAPFALIIADLIQECRKTDPHVIGLFIPAGTSKSEVVRILRETYGPRSGLLDAAGNDIPIAPIADSDEEDSARAA